MLKYSLMISFRTRNTGKYVGVSYSVNFGITMVDSTLTVLHTIKMTLQDKLLKSTTVLCNIE